jgi:ubiquinone/menaquinone biosynthesis C-methylase UbiE
MSFEPTSNMVGGFTDNDGTIDFYLRINSLVSKDITLLDLGAGRAAWFEDDKCDTRRSIRLLKGKVKKVIASDVDEAVLKNRASDEQLLMKNGTLNIPDNSVDLIIADYVLEHIDDPKKFVGQIDRCLKNRGWFCARTPHKYSYVALAASIVPNSLHSKFLNKIQPKNKEFDNFPTKYKMNSLSDIKKYFVEWSNQSFIFRADPAYYFGSKLFYRFQSIIHRFLPAFIVGNIFIFVRKP